MSNISFVVRSMSISLLVVIVDVACAPRLLFTVCAAFTYEQTQWSPNVIQMYHQPVVIVPNVRLTQISGTRPPSCVNDLAACSVIPLPAEGVIIRLSLGVVLTLIKLRLLENKISVSISEIDNSAKYNYIVSFDVSGKGLIK